MTAPQLSVDTVNKSASNNNISQIPEKNLSPKPTDMSKILMIFTDTK